MGIIWALIAGGISGWLAGKFTSGSGFGVLGNILVGIIGAFIGSVVFGLLQISTTGPVGDIIAATAGAVLFLFGIRKLGKK